MKWMRPPVTYKPLGPASASERLQDGREGTSRGRNFGHLPKLHLHLAMGSGKNWHQKKSTFQRQTGFYCILLFFPQKKRRLPICFCWYPRPLVVCVHQAPPCPMLRQSHQCALRRKQYLGDLLLVENATVDGNVKTS